MTARIEALDAVNGEVEQLINQCVAGAVMARKNLLAELTNEKLPAEQLWRGRPEISADLVRQLSPPLRTSLERCLRSRLSLDGADQVSGAMCRSRSRP